MKNLTPTARYLWLTLRHKAFVFRAGLRTRAPIWRLIIHDWTKFTPAEAPHYGRQFFGTKDDVEGFAAAWLHHQNSNPHHWEYWVARTGHDKAPAHNGSLRMPMWAVREMVADWMGASRAYGGEWPTGWSWPWLRSNLRSILIKVHPRTREDILQVLSEVLGHCPSCGGHGYATFDGTGGSICYELDCPDCVGGPMAAKAGA